LATVTVGNKDSKAPQDVIVIRGPSTEVDRIVPALKQIIEDAKNDDLVNGFTQEFTVDKRHVPHLVGSSGSAINKLRELLAVRINFDDDESTTKKSSKGSVVHCKIIGRKEAVEEAKKRLLAQVERLEDETTEVLSIKKSLHPALIGSSGKYAIRLEEKYAVKITFPRDGDDAKSNLKPDEVQVRGGKKGVAGAKAELLEAAEFEKESNQSSSFTVPTSAIARILGKAGSTINSIKDETGAQIDVDKTSDSQTTITVKGDKKAIAAAKASIQSIAAEVADRAEESVTIDPKYVSEKNLWTRLDLHLIIILVSSTDNLLVLVDRGFVIW
jgi:polyribonucleotide nucleotidyltransferase